MGMTVMVDQTGSGFIPCAAYCKSAKYLFSRKPPNAMANFFLVHFYKFCLTQKKNEKKLKKVNFGKIRGSIQKKYLERRVMRSVKGPPED